MKYFLSLLFLSLFSLSLSAKINKQLSEKETIVINSFIKEPYKENYQQELLLSIKDNENYYKSSYLISLLKDIIIYSENNNIKQEALNLYQKDNLSEKDLKEFKKIKDRLNSSIKNILFLKSIGLYESSEQEFNAFNSNNRRNLNEEDLLYKIKYMINKGLNKEALELFTNYINKSLEKKFNNKIKVPFSKENQYVLGDIYAYGAFLNINNQELFNLYKERSLYFYENLETRFLFIIGTELKRIELFKESTYFFEELRIKDKDKFFVNKLFESYYKLTRKELINNNFDSAWISARKGLFLKNEINLDANNKNLYLPIFIELKRYLKESSLKYIEILIEKGEHEHASRIKKETLSLLAEKII